MPFAPYDLQLSFLFLLQSATMTSPVHHRMISLSVLFAAVTLLQVSPTCCFSVSDELPLSVADSIKPYRAPAVQLSCKSAAVRSLA